ncbi:hemolysin [Niastella vici]|uniref:Hemolysin n=1 Tax=Niastella vici TaxID=1703345 RepID=A0A1V9FXZ9_9BACT|nr:hemolysin family protein [Niastella vici]OQP63194.1 hemolysin [Niastella vici]
MEIFILLALIFLNGLFVMSEIALVSARKSRLENMANKGDETARKALDLANNPEVFLSAAQIGITLITILTGLYSGERFGKYLQPSIEKIELLRPHAQTISITIIVIIVTFLSIIFGELIPKRIGLLKAEKIARVVALPVLYFSKATHPFVWLLNKTSNLFLRILRIKSTADNSVTEEEIKAIISEGTEQGAIEEVEQEIIERVFHLSDRNITSLMTHRSDIIWFDMNDTEDSIRDKIINEPHSVYPICDKDLDNIKGMVSLKDLYVTNDFTAFKSILKPAIFVPENITAYRLLERFKQQRVTSTFIVDEYGTLQGMITLNDILTALVGEMPQPDEDYYEIVKRKDGSFLIDAQIPFYNFLSHFYKTEWISEVEQEFDTLAGFILYQLERIPHIGDTFEWKGFQFEIIDMDAQRIDKVLVTASDEILDDMEEESEEDES